MSESSLLSEDNKESSYNKTQLEGILDQLESNININFFNLNYFLTESLFFFSTLFLVLSICFLLYTLEGKIIPESYFQDLIEIHLGFLLKIYKNQLNNRGQYYFPEFYFCFLLIMFINYMALCPYSLGLTSHMTIGLFIGLFLFFIGQYNALAIHQLNFFKIFFPPKSVPKALGLFLSIIELISFLMRIPSLVVRLFANMLAGHLLLEILGSFAYDIFLDGGLIIGIIFGCFLGLIIIIKFFVSFLQAYILIYLSIIYVKEFYDGPVLKH